MKPTTTRMVAVLGLIGAALAAAPTVASAGEATLYELTENMKLVQRHSKHHPVIIVLNKQKHFYYEKDNYPIRWRSFFQRCILFCKKFT